jgi:hypothetical protein
MPRLARASSRLRTPLGARTPEQRDRLVDASHLVCTALVDEEESGDEPVRRLGDQDRVGFRERLNSCGDVGSGRGRASRTRSVAPTAPTTTAAGVDATPRLERDAATTAGSISASAVDIWSPVRTAALRGVVPAACGHPKYASTPSPRCCATYPLKRSTTGAGRRLICGDDLVQVFRIELAGQLGRSDQIAEEHVS